MDERLKLIARLLDGEKMAGLCREFERQLLSSHLAVANCEEDEHGCYREGHRLSNAATKPA